MELFAKTSPNLSISDVFGGPGYIYTLCLMLQKEPPEVFYEKRCSEKFHKTLLKKETVALVFSWEFCEISKNAFFTEYLWTTASDIGSLDRFSLVYRTELFWKLLEKLFAEQSCFWI